MCPGSQHAQSAVNLAVALARNAGLSVGLMDADVYGPSIPRMMNLAGEPRTDESMPHTPVHSLTFSLILALQHLFAYFQAWQDWQLHPFTTQAEAHQLILCRWKALPPAELWRQVHVHGVPHEGALLGNRQEGHLPSLQGSQKAPSALTRGNGGVFVLHCWCRPSLSQDARHSVRC